MKRKIIKLEIEVPYQAKDEDIEEFFQYEFGYKYRCSEYNPFLDEQYNYEVTDFEIRDY